MFQMFQDALIAATPRELEQDAKRLVVVRGKGAVRTRLPLMVRQIWRTLMRDRFCARHIIKPEAASTFLFLPIANIETVPPSQTTAARNNAGIEHDGRTEYRRKDILRARASIGDRSAAARSAPILASLRIVSQEPIPAVISTRSSMMYLVPASPTAGPCIRYPCAHAPYIPT